MKILLKSNNILIIRLASWFLEKLTCVYDIRLHRVNYIILALTFSTVFLIKLRSQETAYSENTDALPNEDVKVDLYYYVEAKARAPGSANLERLVKIPQFSYSQQPAYCPAPMASFTATFGQLWFRSPMYKLPHRAINRPLKSQAIRGANVEKYKLHYFAPDGYEIYWRAANSSGCFTRGSIIECDTFEEPALEIAVLPVNSPGALPGKVGKISTADGHTRFSLGFKPNGKSAGYVDFMHEKWYRFVNTEFYNTFNIAYYRPLSGADLRVIPFDGVSVIYQPIPQHGQYQTYQEATTGIRQIVAPQVVVDVQKQEYDLILNFYHKNQISGRITEENDPYTQGILTFPTNQGPYMFSGEAFVSYRISYTIAYQDGDVQSNYFDVPEKMKNLHYNKHVNVRLNIYRVEGNQTEKAQLDTHDLSYVDAVEVSDECGACAGNGYVDCIRCAGGGFETCHSCDGNGGPLCSRCDGTGDDPFSDTGRVCPVCKGSGLTSKCTRCQGEGETRCSSCGGWGYKECNPCGGGGWIFEDSLVAFGEDSLQLIRVNGFGTVFQSDTLIKRIIGSAQHMETIISSTASRSSQEHFSAHDYNYNPEFSWNNTTGWKFERFIQPMSDMMISLVQDGDSGLETLFEHYYHRSLADPLHDTHHGQIKWRKDDKGGWSMYDYATEISSLNKVIKAVAPWGDEIMPSDIPSPTSVSNFRIATYTYADDWEGRKRLPEIIEDTIDNRKTGMTTHAYSSDAANGAPIWITSRLTWASADGAPLLTVMKIYEGWDCPSWLQGLPYSTETPDGLKEAVAYHRGNVSTDGIFTKNIAGSGFRSVVLRGISPESNTGVLLTAYDGMTIDSIKMIPNISTAEITIRNEYGQTVRTETVVYTEAEWALIDSADMRYDIAGNLIWRKKLNGLIYEADYTTGGNFNNTGTRTGRKQRERDEQGIITTYAYDDRGRVASKTRLAFEALPELKTSFAYDDENRVLSTTIGEGVDAIVTSKTYDKSGRLLTETTQCLTTTYQYHVTSGNLTHSTITLPGGATRIIENYRDGRLKSITGSAGPAEHYTYEVDDNGFLITTKYVGASGTASPRWVKTTTDWLGRTVHQEWPAADSAGGTVTQTQTYNARGQLASSQTGNLAPILYFYDDNAVMNQYGTAISRNATLGDADRKHTFTYGYRKENNAWWDYSETRAYPDGSVDGIVQTRTWTRASRFEHIPWRIDASPEKGIAESIIEDANGNRATARTYLDPTTGETIVVTYTPFKTRPSVSVSAAGRLVSETSATGVVVRYKYDSLGRLIKMIDRTSDGYDGNNIAYCPGSTRIKDIVDNRGVVQHSYVYDSAGRVIQDKTPKVGNDGNAAGVVNSHFAYDIRGQLARVWGDVPYPIRYEYNDFGQRTAQYTFRSPTADATSGGDKTSFTYSIAAGMLLTKADAKGQVVNYAYTPLGQLKQRIWSRGTKTTYAYDPNTGTITNATYTDGTPSLFYAYDRLGRIKTIADATGTRTYTYRHADLQPDQEILGACYENRHIINQYENGTGRFVGLDIRKGTGDSATMDHTIRYAYSPYNARLEEIVSPAGTHAYTYLENSNLIRMIDAGSWVQSRHYEMNRNLLTRLNTDCLGANNPAIVGYMYTNDTLGRRMQVAQGGLLYKPYIALGQRMHTTYGYNDRNELVGAATSVDHTVMPGRNFGYSFDPIGNRTGEVIDQQSHGYQTNELNQYTQRATPSWTPVTGQANRSGGAQIEVNGQRLPSTAWQHWHFYQAEAKQNPGQAYLQEITITGIPDSGSSESYSLHAKARPTTETFDYDMDGNLVSDSLWRFAYDGENRLKWMRCLLADANGDKLSVEFSYDHMGRRVSKHIFHYTGNDPEVPTSKTFASHTTYLYQGWTLLTEYSDLPFGLSLIRRYTWGIDLSGSMGGAGDIGGLLAIEDLRSDCAGIFNPAYDGNGNLMALTRTDTGKMVAAYEYDPFGNVLRASGAYAKENPFRFSGKYYDTETGLSYFGFRYYSASLGRFINRDPLEERGGWNLYSGLKQGAANPYAGASGVEGTSWQTEWEQAQDRLLSNTSLPHTTQSVTFDGKRNSGLPGASERNQKTYSANATGHYSQGGAPGRGPKTPSMSVGNPSKDNTDINLYIFVGNNPINAWDALGLEIKKYIYPGNPVEDIATNESDIPDWAAAITRPEMPLTRNTRERIPGKDGGKTTYKPSFDGELTFTITYKSNEVKENTTDKVNDKTTREHEFVHVKMRSDAWNKFADDVDKYLQPQATENLAICAETMVVVSYNLMIAQSSLDNVKFDQQEYGKDPKSKPEVRAEIKRKERAAQDNVNVAQRNYDKAYEQYREYEMHHINSILRR